MHFKGRGLSAIFCALIQWHQASSRRANFQGETDSSNYMFYDPVDECNNSTEPCITTFKYCSHVSDDYFLDLDFRCHEDAKEGNLTWIDKDEDKTAVFWLELYDNPFAVFDSEAKYTLKWQNNNPKYPSTITWGP